MIANIPLSQKCLLNLHPMVEVAGGAMLRAHEFFDYFKAFSLPLGAYSHVRWIKWSTSYRVLFEKEMKHSEKVL